MNKFDKIMSEAIEGLPDSMDPYAPMQSPENENTEQPSTELQNDPDISNLGGDNTLGDMDQMPLEPQGPVWKPITLPNKKDIAFERSDGFRLRLRQITHVPGKWLAQLWKEKKVLESGQLIIPSDVDPADYVQKMADYMLDGQSERYEQTSPDTAPVQDYGTQKPEQEPLEPDLNQEFPSDGDISKATESNDIEAIDIPEDELELEL